MNDKHLNYFKIENFKKFESLEVKDLRHFNLIVGDNNIGKTCLLEALTITDNFKTTIKYLHDLLVRRGLCHSFKVIYGSLNSDVNFKENEVAHYQRKMDKPILVKLNGIAIEIHNLNEKIKDTTNEEIRSFVEKVNLFAYPEIFPNSSNWIMYKVNGEIVYLTDITSSYYEEILYKERHVVPVITMFDRINDFVPSIYNYVFKEKDFRSQIIKELNALFPDMNIIDLIGFEDGTPFHPMQLWMKTESRAEYHSIKEYGDGFNRCLYFLLLILSNESKRICIDEIDIGIHYSKMEEVWKKLFEMCIKLDVQVFATTHSKECIDTFVAAAQTFDMSMSSLVRLRENKDKSIRAITFTDDEMMNIVEMNIEKR